MTTVDTLKRVLADTYALYLKTQNYHWNIAGANFKEWHMMLEEHYIELAAAVDLIAERIRALGEKAPASFSKFAALTTLKDGDENATSRVMLEDLVKGHELVVISLKHAEEIASLNKDAATENVMSDRLEAHQKTLWMLRASLVT